jgi:hypothetical protein
MENNYSEFTELVLARMESNPEEFAEDGRWSTLTRGLRELASGKPDRYADTLWALNGTELAVLITAYKRIYIEDMHKQMLKSILMGEFRTGVDFAQGLTAQNTVKYKATDRYAHGITDPRGLYESPMMTTTSNNIRVNTPLTMAHIRADVGLPLQESFDQSYATGSSE